MVRIWKKNEASCWSTCWMVRTMPKAAMRIPMRVASWELPKLRKAAGDRARAPIKCFPLPRCPTKKEGASRPPPYFFRFTESGLCALLELSHESPRATLDLLQLQGRGGRVAVRVERDHAGQTLVVGGLAKRVDNLLPARHVAVVGVDRAADRVDDQSTAVLSGERVGARSGRVGGG